MEKENLFGLCDSCDELVEGQLEWNTIDGFISLVGSSEIIIKMLTHHKQFKSHFHNKFVLFKTKEDIKHVKTGKLGDNEYVDDFGFVIVSTANYPFGDIYD